MHIYEEKGIKLPSVTTIVHSLNSDDINRWANILGFRRIKLEDELNRTASFGTLVHSHLQHIVDKNCTEELVKPANGVEDFKLAQVLRKFEKYMERFPYETIFSERTIKSIDLGYAGTLDWFCKINNLKVLCDFKTSKQPYVTMMFQLGGYLNLLRTIGEEPDMAAIITVNETGTKLHPVSKPDLEFYGKVFDSLAKFYIECEYHTNPKPRISYELVDSLTTV